MVRHVASRLLARLAARSSPAPLPCLHQQSRSLNIHEYQGAALMSKFGVNVPKGAVVSSTSEIAKVLEEQFPDDTELVVKSQVLAGGRGLGTFKNGLKGGVHIVKRNQVEEMAGKMLGQVLVTKQTGAEGKPVNQVPININKGISDEEAEKVVKGLAPKKVDMQQGIDQIKKFYKLFTETDCTQVEINPLAETSTGVMMAADAKLNFDDNAAFRQKEIFAMRDTTQEDPREVAAGKVDLNYIGLDGEIGCMVNGAGLAMATMDIIKLSGGTPANFLDVGGNATEQQVVEAFKILTSDTRVKAILVNIFGGIMKCDVIAAGIVAAAKQVNLKVPLVVRLEGTNVDVGKTILKESGMTIITADDLDDAAKKAVKALKQ
jgi:succinyl-CoA synthetase beta subunit